MARPTGHEQERSSRIAQKANGELFAPPDDTNG
jgi:hypothetical protein